MKPISVRRVLPAVIVVGAVLLGVKGEYLVRTALAEGLDILSSDTSILAEDTAPLPADEAHMDSESPGKSDVLASLGKRREALDARETQIDERMQMVAAAEKRVDGKIATLKDLQQEISGLLGKRDEEEQKQIAALVKTYSAMKPRDAARIFNTLSDDVLIPVAAAMKSDALAPVLAAMDSAAAQQLTVRLAERMKTPELAAPAEPPPDAALICTPGADVAKAEKSKR